jgi:hypothetical protein
MARIDHEVGWLCITFDTQNEEEISIADYTMHSLAGIIEEFIVGQCLIIMYTRLVVTCSPGCPSIHQEWEHKVTCTPSDAIDGGQNA